MIILYILYIYELSKIQIQLFYALHSQRQIDFLSLLESLSWRCRHIMWYSTGTCYGRLLISHPRKSYIPISFSFLSCLVDHQNRIDFIIRNNLWHSKRWIKCFSALYSAFTMARLLLHTSILKYNVYIILIYTYIIYKSVHDCRLYHRRRHPYSRFVAKNLYFKPGNSGRQGWTTKTTGTIVTGWKTMYVHRLSWCTIVNVIHMVAEHI